MRLTLLKLLTQEKISWSARKRGVMWHNCYTSVDGTDLSISESRPFSADWFSHKIRGPGLLYEITACISTGDVVSVHVPFACESYPGLNKFKLGLKSLLEDGEKVVADDGYKDNKVVRGVDVSEDEKHTHGRIRARHESVNGRLKTFFILSCGFKHSISLHRS